MNSYAEKYIEKNKNINRGYRKLDVWKEAVELFAFVNEKLNNISNLSFKVKSQILDSILSVSSNIAEGYCRRFIKENIQFNSYALGSLGENYSQIFTLFNSSLIDEQWFKLYDERHYSLENKLVKLNRVNIKKLKNNYDWKNDYQVKEMIEKYLV